ncbi:MAG: hypothetical protein R2939_12760 [Kofleriaceae bacterium]
MRGPTIGLALAATALGAAPLGAQPGAIVRVEQRAVDAAPAVGPIDAPVTIAVYLTPGNRHGPGLDRLLALQARHPRRSRLEVRVLPSPSLVRLPEALLEAAAQGRFFEVERAARDLGAGATADELLAVARSLGLDAPRLAAAWTDGRHADLLRRHDAERLRAGVRAGAVEASLAGRSLARPLSAMDDDALDQAYAEAYQRARAGLDAGVARAELDRYLADELLRAAPRTIPARGLVDAHLVASEAAPTMLDELEDFFGDLTGEGPWADERAPDYLAPGSPLRGPLSLAGWPGLPAPAAEVDLLVACDLRRSRCAEQLAAADRVRELAPDALRVTWVPAYALADDRTGAIGLFHDAARCAVAQGAGWSWIGQALAVSALDDELASDDDDPERDADRADAVDAAIDRLVRLTGLDRRAHARCLAVEAGRSAAMVVALAAAGVVVAPTVVVGAIAYGGGFADTHTLRAVVAQARLPGALARRAMIGRGGGVAR